jgi:IS5 family transposase
MVMKLDTIIDFTLIAAPAPKNGTKFRVSQIHQTKKRNQWYFGM